MNTNAEFGLASLWRKAKHKFTPKVVRDILTSNRFQSRLELWQIIHVVESNTKARFETTKMLRSSDGGLALCYMLRRLGSNIQEPCRTLSLQAIDASIKRWKGKHAPRASALRAPWALHEPKLGPPTPTVYATAASPSTFTSGSCHSPSFKVIFVKHASVFGHSLQSQAGGD